jgi:hypothetical protein
MGSDTYFEMRVWTDVEKGEAADAGGRNTARSNELVPLERRQPGAVELDKCAQAGRRIQIVRVQRQERPAVDERLRSPNGVGRAERLVLNHERQPEASRRDLAVVLRPEGDMLGTNDEANVLDPDVGET